MDVSKRKRIYWIGFALLLFIVYLFIGDDVSNNVSNTVSRYNNNTNYATKQPQQYKDFQSASEEDEGKLLDRLVENEEKERKNESNNNIYKDEGSYQNNDEIEDNSQKGVEKKKEASQDNSEKDVF